MNKQKRLYCMLLIAAFMPRIALAQDAGLHVVKSDINAESENAELCLEFDKTLAPAAPARLAADLHLESDGKTISPQNIEATGASLCLFPLERGKSYHLELAGLRSVEDVRMSAPYKATFTMPERSPSLAFTGRNGGVNGFDSYDNTLTLRAVNVAHAKIEIYKLTDIAALASAWQNRAQTALAPSESAYLARTKGQSVWQGDNFFEAVPNATAEQKISLREKMPDLGPGLYLIIADAGKSDAPASKGLAPLAAAWFTKSDFSLRAFRDTDGLHVFAATTDKVGPKAGLHLIAVNKKPEQVAEAQDLADGTGIIATKQDDASNVIGIDQNGGVAFADIEPLPALASQTSLGTMRNNNLFVVPGEPTDLPLTVSSAATLTSPSLLHLSQNDIGYADIAVAPPVGDNTKASFAAPVIQGLWSLRWQKTDGTPLAEGSLRVTSNPDMPYLDIVSSHDALTSESGWNVTIKSLSSTGKPVPLTSGHVSLAWQRLDPTLFGWPDYHFGAQTALLDASTPVADFTTDLQGVAQLHVPLPLHPSERGLYQAVLKVTADPDAGVADAKPVLAPLRPDATVIGIKPLTTDARFPQNGIARFKLIGLSSDGKPRDITGLSYQVYEEGRRFTWYQDEGRWKYKPASQLRPIGGGPLQVKADGSTVLEWPVTAGNYELEILDAGAKILAQTEFSASWDSTGAPTSPILPLTVSLPKAVSPGHEAIAHVMLPEAAVLTAVIADNHIRKVIHEVRPQGDNEIVFTPGADWQNEVSLSVEAISAGDQSAPMRATLETSLTDSKSGLQEASSAGFALVAAENPAGVELRKDGTTTLTFGIENRDSAPDSYQYAFSVGPGLKIEGEDKGSLTLGGKESRAVTVSLTGVQPGPREIKLDVVGTHAHLNRVWSIAVLPKADGWMSLETSPIEPKQPLTTISTKPHGSSEPVAFVSRHPMDGLAEILSALFNARPYTTAELASSTEALRLWGDVLAQTGFGPDFLIAGKRQDQLIQLLQHQNTDGGFSALRGGDSTMESTAAALVAFGPDKAEALTPAKTRAIAWIKQRLANTWVDEKERVPRASAYAALAAADALDAASLHYFSDTSASATLAPIADANIAAAFKHIRDPDAAAFWIKKMLDQNTHATSVELLSALAATDALSSDDVHAAMASMAEALRHGITPNVTDLAGLLRALAADNAVASKGRLTKENEARDVSGVLPLRGTEITSYRNGGPQSLSITYIGETQLKPAPLPAGATLARHIYRLNGVELLPPLKPMRGEIYMVELKGTLPQLAEDDQVLLQDGERNALRPLGCPLSAKLDTLAFIPWFTTQNLTPLKECSFGPHRLDVVLAPIENDNGIFSVVTFARIDAPSLSEIPPARLRILKYAP